MNSLYPEISSIVHNKTLRERLLWVFLVVLPMLVLVWIFIKAAWLSDDAYITFRTIDNFLNGYGLRWNVAERVQSFTHPLWMGLVMIAVFFTREFYLTVTFLSLACSIMAIILVIWKISPGIWVSFLAIAILISSQAFVDYSTSGLENPLSFLLIAFFAILFFKREESLQSFGWLCFVAGLAVLNRMDMILLYLPALAWTAFSLHRKSKSTLRELAGMFILAFTPFILWEIFSLIYYGFPFPNTAYAKLSTEIPAEILRHKGRYYFSDSITHDYVTLPIIGLAIILSIYFRGSRSLTLAGGICLYLLYIIHIGGDFMSGRFFSVPFFVAVLIISQLPVRQWFAALLAIGAIGAGLLMPKPVLLYDMDDHALIWLKSGIMDERRFYYQCAGFLPVLNKSLEPDCKWVKEGKDMREENLVITQVIGFHGFYAGPSVHIVDTFGLTDPFLGRLPSDPRSRIGHFSRGMPAGYEATLRQKENLLEYPKHRKLFTVISTITRDPIFSVKRFKEIVKINVGMYDHLAVNPAVRPDIE
ncbi:MAG: hypothetical protein WD077_09625 [Bacteroidia bacterium]